MRLLMLSAMYENGGNAAHRFLDGHPQMLVYPFESQLGTRGVVDALSSVFPLKYRWPAFDLASTAAQDFEAIIDEEVRVRARTPHVSKFRDSSFDLSDDERGALFREYVSQTPRSRGGNVLAFFKATFDAWRDYRRPEAPEFYVGYSPIVVVDADKILSDLPDAHVLHIVRNPWSAYADTKRRPVPLSLAGYMLAWTLNQYHALCFRDRYRGRVHMVRAEDIFADPIRTLGGVCGALGLDRSESLSRPTYNNMNLDDLKPWGMLGYVTPEANRATAAELSPQERGDVAAYAWQYLDVFDYRDFLTAL
jgi:hypothetical protein